MKLLGSNIMIVDEEKESVEISTLNNNRHYFFDLISADEPFGFKLSGDCKINVLLKNIWE